MTGIKSRAGVKSRKWVEDESPPPTDLRLVPAAVALWSGSLVGLLVGQIAWLAAGLALIAVVGLFVFRVRWRPGWLVVFVCLAAGIAISVLRVGLASNDPLVVAATRGSWATLTVSAAGFPRAVDSGFIAPDDAN